jgi:hypothetical protein
MSISTVDTGSLEAITQFAKFLDLIKDSQKLSDLIETSKKILVEYKTLLGVIKTKEDADNYKNSVVSDLEKQQKFLDKKLDNYSMMQEKWEQDKKQYEIAYASQVSKFNDAYQKMLVTQGDLEKSAKEREKLEADLDKRTLQVEVREAEVAKLRDELQTKVEQVKALVGG